MVFLESGSPKTKIKFDPTIIDAISGQLRTIMLLFWTLMQTHKELVKLYKVL